MFNSQRKHPGFLLARGQSKICVTVTVTWSRSWPISWEEATTSLSAIHCSSSSTSRLSRKCWKVWSSFFARSSASSFSPAYCLSTWPCLLMISSLRRTDGN